ncbi:MAG: flagellar biosynthetic protein FliO [Proteobacteria bacterium]|nr:flagellar biosynthetic protein FliO [Pseudomonadota bacterium]
MFIMLLTQQPIVQSWQNYAIFILETMVALAVIALAAWVVVRVGRTRFGRGGKSSRMRVVERLVLEPRRSVYLIEVDGRTMLVGTGEGSVQLLENFGPRKTGDLSDLES